MKKRWDSKELIKEAIKLFKKANIPQPRLNAELIMVHCMNKDRLALYSDYKKLLNQIETNYFRNLCKRRLQNEPVQYIIGETEFMSLPFKVNNHVLIPRPETEVLVEKVMNHILENKKNGYRVLDLGTGSGNIIISLAKYAPGCIYYASDISKNALKVAKKNVILNKIKDKIHFINSDGFNSFKKKRMFNVIVSNPPYIRKDIIKNLPEHIAKYEPIVALDGGEDGLDMIRYIIDEAHKYMKKNALLAIEFAYDQNKKVRDYAMKSGKYKNIAIVRDLSENYRVILMYKK